MRFTFIWVLALMLVLVGCQQNTESAISYSEVVNLTGDVARGERVYHESINNAPPCSACHMEGSSASPGLVGYGEIAGTRVEGQDAHEYTFYSIAQPGQFIVDGYGNAMYNQYDSKMTAQEIADLIAYLLSL